MNNYDVLIIGGYGLGDRSAGDSETRDKIRLSYKNHLASLDFIRLLVQNKSNLDLAEQKYIEGNKARLVARSINTIYLYDFLLKNGVKPEAINYFLLEQNKFRELISLKPKVVVISTTFIYDASNATKIAKCIKELSPNSIIIAGGIKVLKSFKKYSLYKQGYFDGFAIEPMKTMNFFFDNEIDKNIDVFVIEECGELTLLELIKKIKAGHDHRNMPNIAYREKGNLFFSERIKEPYTFEKSLISWDKIPEEMVGQEVPVSAGLGCPFKCAFCDFPGLHQVKIRKIDDLIKELKLIQERFSGRTVFFTDDNLFTTKKRTKELAEAIVKYGLNFKWRAFFRVDAISEDNVEVLSKSGCVSCLLGVESGDEEILKNMNKRATREQIIKAINLLNQNRINTLSTIIIGFPGETKESVNNTISLLNEYPDNQGTINQYCPFVFNCTPLAPIASPENRKKYKIVGGHDKWSHITMNSEEAKGHLIRCFQEITVPTLQYPEFMDPEIPFLKLKDIFKTRDNIVRNGLNVVGNENVQQIYHKFSKIFI